MNLESLVRDANPAPLASIPGPDSPEARRTLVRLTADHQGIDGLSHRSPLKRSRVWAVVAAAAVVVAAVVTPLVADHSTSSPAHFATRIPAAVSETWRLAGYITQPGLQVSSGSTSLSTSQQSTTQLACPTVTTCYSDGTNVPSVKQNSQSVITVTHDGGATWHQVLSPGHDVYFFGFTCCHLPALRDHPVASSMGPPRAPPQPAGVMIPATGRAVKCAGASASVAEGRLALCL
jgi:hypothetical protein